MNIIGETSKSFGSDSSAVSLPHIQQSSQSNVVLVRQTSSGPRHSSNCCCAKCTGHDEEERSDKQTNCSSNITEISALEHHSNRCKGHSVPVQLNDHVVIRGGRIGHIRYIGPLHHGNSNTKNTIYLGLQLDEPHGHHDGIHNGKRYFWCQKPWNIYTNSRCFICNQIQDLRLYGLVDSSKTSAYKRERSGTRNRPHSHTSNNSKTYKRIPIWCVISTVMSDLIV